MNYMGERIMQPFVNPQYFNQYQQPQNYNPYMDRLNNLQQYQQSLQQPMLPTQMSGANQFTPLGKIVDSVDMVKVADIPMDGNAYYFPKADGTEIYSKQFMPNGQTRILIFKPFLENESSILPTDEVKMQFGAFGEVLEGIQNDIKMLNEKIDRIKPTRAKKESVEDAE